jgi:FkbM family methyltransferase
VPRAGLDRAYGLARSLRMYYGGGRARAARLDAFYAAFVRPGSLCFDVGAHVGDRSRSWSRLGATVVAVEPQPDFARLLRLLFRRDPAVTVLETAAGAAPGRLTLRVSPRTPTVTTGSASFIAETTRVPSFAWVDWSGRLDVPVTTLDRLIAEHGEPDFAKIDVEGMEHEVLAGLSRPLRALSFEFVPSSPSSALASLDRLEGLGRYRYEVSLGEEMRLRLGAWVDAAAIRAWLAAREPEGVSGDVYARLVGG